VSKGRREVASRSALIRARHHNASDEIAECLGATVVPHSGAQHRRRLMLKGDDDLREVHAKARRPDHEEGALGQGGCTALPPSRSFAAAWALTNGLCLPLFWNPCLPTRMHGVLRTKRSFACTASSVVYVRRVRLRSGLDLGRSAEVQGSVSSSYLAVNVHSCASPLTYRPSTRGCAPHRFLPPIVTARASDLSLFPMDQSHTTMPEDDDSMAVVSEGESATSEYSETDLLNKIEHARNALASSPLDHPDRAEQAASLGYYLYMLYEHTGDISLIDEAIEVEREALALRPPGHSDRARSCTNLGSLLQARYQQTGDVALLDEAIEVEREALALQPPGHPDRARSCINLGSSLRVRYQQTGNVAVLGESIELEREAIALQPPDHPNRARSCANLGYSLRDCYDHTGDISLIDEAIEVEREALALRPPGHPDRARSCTSLGSLLHVCYQQTGNVALLDEAIKLEREALALQPPDHPNRAWGCANLGVSLRECYDHTGDLSLINEAIEVDRQALALRPPGHPDRARSCTKLGVSLSARYKQTGDVALLDEAVELDREALALHPPGHLNRENSCANLGVSLHAQYKQTGDVAQLDEAIGLEREALALRPPGHPDRAISCANLGSSLQVRYQQTGDGALLDEAIDLEREALVLQPPGHPDRVWSCTSLGTSLSVRYKQTSDVALLDEAIKLQREALALQPPGHPYRADSCTNLGYSLHMRYQETPDVALLDEAIELKREVLTLQPLGHHDRADSCAYLVSSLHIRFQQTGDVTLLDEAREACIYASEHSSTSRAWHPLTQLAEFHLLYEYSHDSVSKALEYLQQSFQHEIADIHTFISHICYNLSLVWHNSGVWNAHITALLVDVYAKMVDQLPLVAGFVLDTSSRLQHLKPTRRIGSDAFVAAVLADQPATAVTLIDRAHGVVWSQALRQRDPQMDGAPASLSTELEGLLSAIATRPPVDPAELPDQRGTQDLRYKQHTRIQAILRQIRAMPGLSHFMLGSTYETLREAARDHPVVMLVAASDHAFALIIPSSSNESPVLLHLSVTWNTLQSLADPAGTSNLRYRTGSTGYRRAEASDQDISLAESTDQERAMRDGNFASEWSPLASLWYDVVKPVLMRLRFVVRHPRTKSTQH
jgi:tetratricopeptide (TPR) repeat protein